MIMTLHEEVKKMDSEKLDYMIRLCSSELLSRLQAQILATNRAEDDASRLRFPDTTGQ